MANEEAKKLLDALMGSDRNAPLPKGAARPGSNAAATPLQKKERSCYDRNIDPLFTAWGIDVYELFVNTKSDIGTNPYIADMAAHKEYRLLPPQERAQLGFEFRLFQKLNELVRSCDRLVSRNNEKLKQEIQRKQLNTNDIVEQIDPIAVDSLARSILQAEEVEKELTEKSEELQKISDQEAHAKKDLEPMLLKKDEDSDAQDKEKMKELQLILGRLTLSKQKALFDLSHSVGRLAALRDSISHHRRQLEMIKSDISTDKTVCKVSGNFMSARDADERIAAHYAGKQYVGWKLVRDKFAEMVKEFGRYGPPPPPQQQQAPPHRNDYHGRGGGGRGDFRGRGGNRYPDNRGGNYRGGGGGYNDNRGRYQDNRGWRR